ncbi:MAG TPA: asparagine synthase (glutamine-hydrolyzing) [Syntrophobacteraceae bacterium]|nr:asparagine synthase (glutamine-hydrolyzing) [Syntrophobacteraceae bacterium]
MCGICGKFLFDENRSVDERLLWAMADVMRHRGPDDEGFYISGSVGLGHRRLSIIDLNTGKQPICNEDGTVWIVFNGEIYNYREIRKQLVQKGHAFASQTDTEVIIHAYEEYGEDCVTRLRGMFAFAIWDDRSKTLLLARDRVGIKPVYYFLDEDQLVFASEIKAILKDASVPREIDLPIVDRFLTYFYLPGNETLFKGIRKLGPGQYLIVRRGKVEIKSYWDLVFAPCAAGRTFDESKDELLDRLREAVEIHMISDVPVGFLLSGGVDSTALLSLAIQQTNKDISTFTLGFSGEGFADERPYARLAAKAFGTKHYDLTISSGDFADFLPKYVWHMEEPVCEPPAVALYYVSKLASQYVKVLISGEGGDEAFAGYPNYRSMVWLERLKRVIGPLKGAGAGVIETLLRAPGFGRLRKFIPLVRAPFEDYYLSRTSSPFLFFNCQYPSIYTKEFLDLVCKEDSCRPTTRLAEAACACGLLDRMLYVDTMSWLPDDLLVKADKITMANSVELRVPLLDHEVLEFAACLPSSYKLHGITTKYILKTAFRKVVPHEILDRKKTGFPVPYGVWMRKELRSLVEDTLLSRSALDRGYFTKQGLEKLISANLNGRDHSKEVFSLLVLELWHREFIDRDAAAGAPGA